MKHLFHRIRLRTLAPVLALGLVVGPSGLALPAAYAQDNAPTPAGKKCYRNGVEYNEGDLLKSYAAYYKCKNGQWVFSHWSDVIATLTADTGTGTTPGTVAGTTTQPLTGTVASR